MKILVLLSRFPYPLEKGDKLRAYYQIKELSKNNELILCALSDKPIKPEWLEEINNICDEVHLFKLNKFLMYLNTIKQVFTNKPYQTGYFHQKRIQKKIETIIHQRQPGHIYCQLIRTTEYVKNIHNIPKTLDYMDSLSKGMYRRAEISKGIWKKLFLIEGKRLAEYENRIFDYFNFHTIISEQDCKFINHPSNNKIAIIENGISDDFSHYKSTSTNREFELVFTGNMNYPPNVECAEFIVDAILPKLLNDYPTIKILLSGANPHPRVQELAINEHVTVTGWVEDIRTSYASGKIFLAPLFIGTGLQNKLLEAMAMGLPAITTPLANNALSAAPEKDILIASNTEQFVSAIKQILGNEDLWTSLSNNGRLFVTTKYNWAKSIEKLEKFISKNA